MNIALNIEIGDMVEVELSNGSIVKGKVEKENPFKIRTDATSTQVIPDALIKNISLSMAGVVGDVGSKGVTDKYTYTTPIKEIETAKKGGKIDGGGKGSEFMFWAGLLGLGVLSYIGVNKK